MREKSFAMTRAVVPALPGEIHGGVLAFVAASPKPPGPNTSLAVDGETTNE